MMMSTRLAWHTQPEMIPIPLVNDPVCGFSSIPFAHRGDGAVKPTVTAVMTMTARDQTAKRVFHIPFALLSGLCCNTTGATLMPVVQTGSAAVLVAYACVFFQPIEPVGCWRYSSFAAYRHALGVFLSGEPGSPETSEYP